MPIETVSPAPSPKAAEFASLTSSTVAVVTLPSKESWSTSVTVSPAARVVTAPPIVMSSFMSLLPSSVIVPPARPLVEVRVASAVSLSSSRLTESVPVVLRSIEVSAMLPSEFTVRSTSKFVAVIAARVTVLPSPVASTTLAVVSAPLSRIAVTFVPTLRSPVVIRATPPARSTCVVTSLTDSVVVAVTSPSRSTVSKSLIEIPAVSVVIVPEKAAESLPSSPPSIAIVPASS